MAFDLSFTKKSYFMYVMFYGTFQGILKQLWHFLGSKIKGQAFLGYFV